MVFLDALLEPFDGRLAAIPIALAKYAVNPEFRVMVKVRHIQGTRGRWSWWLSLRLRRRYSIVFSSTAVVGKGLRMPHYVGTVIGGGVVMGQDCVVYHQVTLGQSRGVFPTIGDDVIMYSGAKIVGDVRVGSGAVIGANAVVTSDVPAGAIVAGVPAKVVGMRNTAMGSELS